MQEYFNFINFFMFLAKQVTRQIFSTQSLFLIYTSKFCNLYISSTSYHVFLFFLSIHISCTSSNVHLLHWLWNQKEKYSWNLHHGYISYIYKNVYQFQTENNATNQFVHLDKWSTPRPNRVLLTSLFLWLITFAICRWQATPGDRSFY